LDRPTAANFFVIGIEIRTGWHPDKSPISEPKLIEAALHYFTCAQKVAHELRDHKPVKYYISTDVDVMYERAALFFGADSIIKLHAANRLLSRKPAMYRAAIDSIYLGMYADELVLTPNSAMGMLAAVSLGKSGAPG
jgi:hypothetical protein